VIRFGEFVRKIWNPANFKGHVSPHELFQAVTLLSNRKFQIGAVSEVVEFLSWFLNALHTELGGSKTKATVVTDTFQGLLEVTTEKLEKQAEDMHSTAQIKVVSKSVSTIPFLFLSMDPPNMPIFKDAQERNIIPQIPLYTALAKYDGKAITPAGELQQKRYHIKQLPKFMILVFRRFKHNNFFTEKNRTIVTFPLKNLEWKDYVSPSGLRGGAVTKFDLVANILHEGDTEKEDTYAVHVQDKATKRWYRIRDMDVEEAAPQLLSVSEASIQIYEQKSAGRVKEEEEIELKLSAEAQND